MDDALFVMLALPFADAAEAFDAKTVDGLDCTFCTTIVVVSTACAAVED